MIFCHSIILHLILIVFGEQNSLMIQEGHLIALYFSKGGIKFSYTIYLQSLWKNIRCSPDSMHKWMNQFVVLKSQYLFNEQIYFVDELKWYHFIFCSLRLHCQTNLTYVMLPTLCPIKLLFSSWRIFIIWYME